MVGTEGAEGLVTEDWRDQPTLRELDGELRERIGEEFRAEAEEAERLAALAALRGRDLADVATDLRSRGDAVAVVTAGRTVTGRIVYVGADFFQLRLGRDVVDVSLGAPLTIRTVERATSGGVAASHGPGTLRARLLELELEDARVEIVTVTGELVTGAVHAVGRDHVLLDGDVGEVYVPTAVVALVTTRTG
jgi:hypothetical protein